MKSVSSEHSRQRLGGEEGRARQALGEAELTSLLERSSKHQEDRDVPAASTKGGRHLTEGEKQTKRKFFKKERLGMRRPRKRPRRFWESKETATGFIQYKQVSSPSGSGKGNPPEVGRGGPDSKPVKQGEVGLKS